MAPTRRSALLAAASLVAVTFAPGCRTVDYTPRLVPIEEVEIAEYKNRPAVALRNVGKPGKLLIVEMGSLTCNGDLNDWTRVAIELATSELGKRGVTVAEGAAKSVDLAITKVEVIRGFAAIRCILYLHASTADGLSLDVEGNNASPATLWRAMDGAVTRAVTALLANEQFRAWLEKP